MRLFKWWEMSLVKELVLWNKNTEIITVIIKEILYTSLHGKRV